MIDSKNDINGQELHVLKLQLGEATRFVKSASVKETEELEALESRHFANPADRVFPVHSKEATERSVVYFFGNRFNGSYDSSFPVDATEDRLKKAARFWGTTDLYYASKRACIASQEDCIKEATVTTVYALEGKLPISTPEQVLKSASALIDQRRNVPFTARSEAALKILKAAATMDIPDADFDAVIAPLQKMAGICVKDRKDISDGLIARAEFFERSGIDADVYKSAAESVRDCYDNDIDVLCGLIDAFEHTTKAAKVKASDIEDVFYATLNAPEQVTLKSGSVITFDNIKSAGLAPFIALGESVPMSVTNSAGQIDIEKAASFLECLPKEDAYIFTEAIKQCLK